MDIERIVAGIVKVTNETGSHEYVARVEIGGGHLVLKPNETDVYEISFNSLVNYDQISADMKKIAKDLNKRLLKE